MIIDNEIKYKIYRALNGTSCKNPLSRVQLVDAVGVSDRIVRLYIAEACPDIGGTDGGYFICRTDEDYDVARAELKSRVGKLNDRIERSEKCQFDSVQFSFHPRPVEAVECPEYLKGVSI